MGPRALDIVCKTIEDEMDTIAKGESLPGLSTISPNFIKSWMIADVSEQAPFLMQVLRRAAQTSLAKDLMHTKYWYSDVQMCNILAKQLSYHCSGHALGFPSQFGLFIWTSACSTSIFVEQCGSSGPAKLTSGTFGVLYKHFKLVKGLKYNHNIHPTHQQHKLFYLQLRVAVVCVLLKYCPAFHSYAKDPALQNLPCHPMPPGYTTEQFPIRATTIEKATVNGNLLYHDDIYLNQLGWTQEDLILQARDINPWTQRKVFQLGFGLFHLCLNLLWALLHIHCGLLEQTGSLEYFFMLIEKTCLKGEHPDYHMLLSALMQILDGIMLNAWRHKSGHTNLGEFTSTEPLAEDLLSMAGDIIEKHATPLEMPNTFKKKALAGLLQAKGLQSTWDHLRNISVAVDIQLKKQVATSMKTAYQGTTHKAPKTDHLVW
ncbi:hypothetical protein EI94DRAFT_1775285 [Lactarius quietus]|nr:hypothetical protein EI94DRAFT_1775285 [Lactarius quietus]